MKYLISVLISMLIVGCASTPVSTHPDTLFSDHSFAAPTDKIDAKNIFAINDKMREFLRTVIAEEARSKGPQQALFDALYAKSQLRIEYDAEKTRNAIEAFEARSGNCLSMAIMTAALAREIDIKVTYRNIFVNEAWTRNGGLYVSAGHVNVTLQEKKLQQQVALDIRRPMTIDFLPISDLKNHSSEVIEEETIIAMYMNNRAAESLAEGKLDNAYWWARNAIENDAYFSTAYNTLGAVYRAHGNLHEAQVVFNALLERDPKDLSAMINLAQVLKDQGKKAESAQLIAKVEQMRPYRPYHFFDLGQEAMRNKQYREARDLFTKEVDRAPESPEFNFWLAAAYLNLGEINPAGKYMTIAMDNSATLAEHSLYQAKLNAIRAKQRATH